MFIVSEKNRSSVSRSKRRAARPLGRRHPILSTQTVDVDNSFLLTNNLRCAGFEQHCIESGTLWLNQSFIPPARATSLLQTLIVETQWTQPVVRMGAKTLLSPRLAAWHGDPEAVYTYSGARNIPSCWTETLQQIRTQLERSVGVQFNSVLLNYYRNGEDSMGWHRDNERELGPQPLIASISLGEKRRFLMQHVKDKHLRWKADLESGSALIMAGQTQKYWRHSLPKSKSRNQPRINLTFRRIY